VYAASPSPALLYFSRSLQIAKELIFLPNILVCQPKKLLHVLAQSLIFTLRSTYCKEVIHTYMQEVILEKLPLEELQAHRCVPMERDTYRRACAREYKQAHTNTKRTQTRTCTQVHTHTHANAHKCTHTNTHIHTCIVYTIRPVYTVCVCARAHVRAKLCTLPYVRRG